MDYQRSSTVAKTGLALGASGLGIGLLNGLSSIFGGGNGAAECSNGLSGFAARGHRHFEHEFVREKDLHWFERLNAKDDEILALKAERYADARVEMAVAPLRAEIAALKNNAAMTGRDVADVQRWAECTFVPQEKGYMDGRRVNYHGVHPELGIDHDDKRFRRHDECFCEG